MECKPGDKVVVRKPGDKPIHGKVIIKQSTWNPGYGHQVEYIVKHEVTGEMSTHKEHFVAIDDQHYSTKDKCQCASNKLGHPGHSTWCDLYTKEYK